jgi:hypothetical protein
LSCQIVQRTPVGKHWCGQSRTQKSTLFSRPAEGTVVGHLKPLSGIGVRHLGTEAEEQAVWIRLVFPDLHDVAWDGYLVLQPSAGYGQLRAAVVMHEFVAGTAMNVSRVHQGNNQTVHVNAKDFRLAVAGMPDHEVLGQNDQCLLCGVRDLCCAFKKNQASP